MTALLWALACSGAPAPADTGPVIEYDLTCSSLTCYGAETTADTWDSEVVCWWPCAGGESVELTFRVVDGCFELVDEVRGHCR